MNISEKWKKTILNKWIIYKKGKEKHCFLLTRLYWKTNWSGRILRNNDCNALAVFNGYHATEKKGSILDFKYLQELSTDLEAWGKCSYLNDSQLLKKLRKKLTKHLLRDEEAYESNIFVFKNIFEINSDENYY